MHSETFILSCSKHLSFFLKNSFSKTTIIFRIFIMIVYMKHYNKFECLQVYDEHNITETERHGTRKKKKESERIFDLLQKYFFLTKTFRAVQGWKICIHDEFIFYFAAAFFVSPSIVLGSKKNLEHLHHLL